MNFCPGCQTETNCVVIDNTGNRFKMECLECQTRFVDYVETVDGLVCVNWLKETEVTQ